MITSMRLTTVAIALFASSLVMNGCAKKEDEETEDEEETDGGNGGGGGGGGSDETLTLSGQLSVGASLSLAPALADLVLYCVSFEATPRSGSSDFGADGAFSVIMPVNVNFGCFVNNRADSSVVGTFVVEGGGEGFAASNTSSMALSGNLDLGAITLGEDGKVRIPVANLASAQYVAAEGEGIVLDELHNAEYDMTCMGDEAAVAKCQDQLMENNDTTTVFFRVLKATEDGAAVEGLGVWASQASFAACGSKDFATGEFGDSEGEPVFSQADIGDFDPSCEKRDPAGELTSRNLREYFAVSKVTRIGGGYGFRSEDKEMHGVDCEVEHTTSIEFSGTSAEMYGAFVNEEVRRNCEGVDVEVKNSAFSVRFVKK